MEGLPAALDAAEINLKVLETRIYIHKYINIVIHSIPAFIRVCMYVINNSSPSGLQHGSGSLFTWRAKFAGSLQRCKLFFRSQRCKGFIQEKEIEFFCVNRLQNIAAAVIMNQKNKPIYFILFFVTISVGESVS
jgi:hypothetical protein